MFNTLLLKHTFKLLKAYILNLYTYWKFHTQISSVGICISWAPLVMKGICKEEQGTEVGVVEDKMYVKILQ